MATVPPSKEAPGNREQSSADTSVPSDLNGASTVLEKDIPISQSLIWRWQREFYAQRGLKSWTEDMVPQFITNNPFIAEIYARIVFGFICDCIDFEEKDSLHLSPQNPLRILELGAGPGKFSFLFLRHLEMLLQSRNISLSAVCYCMTDCSESLIQVWRANRFLLEFFDRGILQFELFDASGEIAPRFLVGDHAQPSTQARGPLVVIANYVFDSLPHDAFLIKEGQVLEFLQTARSAHEKNGRAAPEALSQLQFSYKNVAIPSNRYPSPIWNDILELYRHRLPGATVLFPSQALETLSKLTKFTDRATLVLVSDKGYLHEDNLLFSQGVPRFEFHSPHCFSQMVNFHAIAKYFEAIGGEALLPDKHSSKLNICAFLQDELGRQFPATKERYQEVRSAFDPDDLFALLGGLNPHMEEMSVAQILALLRLSRWDPTTLIRLFPVLVRQMRNVSAERNDIRNAVLLTWANHFPVSPSDNVLVFYCGVILLGLRFFEDALPMFKQAQEVLGRSATTSYNLGLCSLGLGRTSEALAFMTDSCQLDPAFEPALLMRRKIEAEPNISS